MQNGSKRFTECGCIVVLAAMMSVASAQALYAGDLSAEIAGATVYAGPPAAYCHCQVSHSSSGFGFGPGMGYSVINKAPHTGFDLNGDGVHPPIAVAD